MQQSIQGTSAKRTQTFRYKSFGTSHLQMISIFRTDCTIEAHCEYLNKHIDALLRYNEVEYGKSSAAEAATHEMRYVRDIKSTPQSLLCKQALILSAVAKEKTIAQCFSGQVEMDLHTRVLPFLFPRYIQDCGQLPLSFVTSALVLSEMWEGETFMCIS